MSGRTSQLRARRQPAHLWRKPPLPQTAELVEELASAGAAALGVRLEAGAWERLAAYARSVANYPTALKEFEWRNGWFKELSREASASGKQDPCPMHTRLLAGLGY